MKLRIDIRPYFPNIARYYWEELEYDSEVVHMSIWDWLHRDYGIIKIGSIGIKPELWVHFPDEKKLAWFMLRWA